MIYFEAASVFSVFSCRITAVASNTVSRYINL